MFTARYGLKVHNVFQVSWVRNADSSVGIAIRLRAGRSEIRFRAWVRDFYLPQSPLWLHPAPRLFPSVLETLSTAGKAAAA